MILFRVPLDTHIVTIAEKKMTMERGKGRLQAYRQYGCCWKEIAILWTGSNKNEDRPFKSMGEPIV